MVILLLTLLAISLIITFAGVLLSPRSYAADRRGAYVDRVVGVRRVSGNRYIHIKRYRVGVERNVWMNICALLDVRKLFFTRAGEKTPWMGVLLILLSFFLLGVSLLQTSLPNSALILALSWQDVISISPASHTTSITQPQQPQQINASKAIKRIGQMSPNQYNSQQEFATWGPSSCSAAAMAVVMNAYGQNFRVIDVLKTEISVKAISSELGLLDPGGIERTVAKFNFKTKWMKNITVEELVKTANAGAPAIINFPPQAAWPGGHLLVVNGGDNNNVFLTDSSNYNIKSMSRQQFDAQWSNWAAIVTPK